MSQNQDQLSRTACALDPMPFITDTWTKEQAEYVHHRYIEAYSDAMVWSELLRSD